MRRQAMRGRTVVRGFGVLPWIAASMIWVCAIPDPAAGAGGSLRPIVRSTVRFSTDGTRYAAWQTRTDGPIAALDTETGRRWTAHAAGCELVDLENAGETVPAGDGRFLVLCNGVSGLLNTRRGAVLPLPSGPDDPRWSTVGSRYLEGIETNASCSQSPREIREQQPCVALYELATGIVTYRPRSLAGELDIPGAPPICRAIRARLHGNRSSYSDGVLVELGKQLRIRRCHGASELIPAPRNATYINLSANVLSWDTGVLAEELPEPQEALNGTLTAYSLRFGWRRQFRLPRIFVSLPEHPKPGVYGYSAHTANTVFWVATRTVVVGHAGVTTGTSDVYAAKL